MARFTFSIRTRLTLYVLAFVAIIAGMAVSGIFSMRSVDLRTKEIDGKWLAGTALLAETADRIAEYRIAEGYRALATEPRVRAQAELLADGHRKEIQTLESEYVIAADASVDRLVAANRLAAHTQAAAIDDLTERSAILEVV